MGNDSYKEYYAKSHSVVDEKQATAEELDKLLSLAEDVSNKVKHLDSEVSVNKQKLYWLVGVIYAFVSVLVMAIFFLDRTPFEYDHYLYIIFSSLVVVIAFPFSIMLANIRKRQMKLREDIQVESSVLRELLDLIHELDAYGRYMDTIDPVSLATIRMRLKRLRFSVE